MSGQVSPDLSEGYCPPLSLWKLVQQHVPPSEQGEIKSMLGECKVEEAEELRREVDMLLDIWQDLRSESDRAVAWRCTGVGGSVLPEPPGVRERLTQEISFFLHSVRSKAENEGRDPEKALSHYKPHVVDYVLRQTPGLSRPGTRGSQGELSRSATAMNREGRETPAFRCTPNSDKMSLSSTISDDVESMSDKLNILLLDDVVLHLRQYLDDEREQLVRDVHFLQQCLEDEASYRDTARAVSDPNLTELREERAKLEKDVLDRVSPPMASRLRTKPTAPPLHIRTSAAVTSASVRLASQLQQLPQRDDAAPRSAGVVTQLKFKIANPVDVSALHSIASSSAAATAMRPSSALRFRKMVMECRSDGP